MSDFSIEPAYYLPGTFIPLINRTYTTNNSTSSTKQTSSGVETTTQSSTSKSDYPVGDIGIKVNNLISIDYYGNILIDLISLFNLEGEDRYLIENQPIQYSREGTVSKFVDSRFLKKDKEYHFQDENVYEINFGKEKPFISFTPNGMIHYTNGILSTTKDAIELNKNQNYELTGSMFLNIEAIQESQDQIIIKLRMFLDGFTIKLTQNSLSKISIEVIESLFKKRKYTFEVKGSEILFTNDKQQGFHLILSEDYLVVEETRDALIGNKVTQYSIAVTR